MLISDWLTQYHTDRVLAVEQKFFCDRTTEKTVTLKVTDNQNSPVTLTNSTQRLSCQYPLSAVKDLSELHFHNVYNNSWKYVKTEETDCDSEESCQNQYHDNGTVIAREYEAWLSARKDETIRFHVKFSKGSHMRFTWMLDEDLGSDHAHVEEINERCMTKASNNGDMESNFLASSSWTTGVKNCTFPFRYNGVLYYACTNLTIDSQGPFHACATEIDLDFNAVTLGECDITNRCPTQRKIEQS